MFFKKKIKYTPDMKRDKVLEYLKAKYDEEFVAKSMNEAEWGQGSDKLYCYPKNGTTDDMFTVWGRIMDDNTYSMHDSYFKVLIKDKYEEMMSKFVGEIYSEFRLHTWFGVGVINDKLNKNTKVNEIYDIDSSFSSETKVYVMQNEEIDVVKSLKKIAQKMVDNKMVGEVILYEVYAGMYTKLSNDTSNIMHDINIFEMEKYFVNVDGKSIWINKSFTINEVE